MLENLGSRFSRNRVDAIYFILAPDVSNEVTNVKEDENWR
jgi:hypothetical protein